MRYDQKTGSMWARKHYEENHFNVYFFAVAADDDVDDYDEIKSMLDFLKFVNFPKIICQIKQTRPKNRQKCNFLIINYDNKLWLILKLCKRFSI